MCLWHVTIGNREWQLSVALSLEETAGGAAGSVTSTAHATAAIKI